jgi:hypothetical protein
MSATLLQAVPADSFTLQIMKNNNLRELEFLHSISAV